MPRNISKDPADVIDVVNDWSGQMTLDNDYIQTSTWFVVGGLDEDDDPVPGWLFVDLDLSGYSGTSATAWISGGTAGERYDLTNTVNTAGGRTFERTRRVHVYEH